MSDHPEQSGVTIGELTRLVQTSHRRAAGRCPSLSRVAEASRSEDREAVAAHAASCPRCGAIVRAAASAAADTAPPAHLVEAARALFHPVRPHVLRVGLEAIGTSLRVAELVGGCLEPAPVRSAMEDGVLVERRMGAHTVAAHLSCHEPSRFDILVDVWPDHDDPGPVRLSLYRDGRELASEVARHGRVLLPSVAAGRYRVVLTDRSGYAGELDLTFQASPP